MKTKSLRPRLALVAAGSIASLLVAGSAAQATLLPTNLTAGVLGIVDTSLSGQATASLAAVSALSTTAGVRVSVLGADAKVLTSANVKIAADARLTVAYKLTAGLGTLASVNATPAGNGCVALAVVATGAVKGEVKATVTTGGTSTVVQVVVATMGSGTAAKVLVCA